MPRYIAAFSDSSSSRLYRRAVLRREADPSPSHLEMLSSFSFLEKKRSKTVKQPRPSPSPDVVSARRPPSRHPDPADGPTRHPKAPTGTRPQIKMARAGALLLASLLLAAALADTWGTLAKEKRGWTLNSAGYLLGPHAMDTHRALRHRAGLPGRRELQPADDSDADSDADGPGGLARTPPEGPAVRTIGDFLSFLRLRETGVLEGTPEDTELSRGSSWAHG
ncbi:galanin peptides [Erinaceus europaeus]|uniref:Galanin peptides n=1 Tax=Erinaceus europaeus TaxID=9365 RepID=A0ABM3W9T4_ERIEU|nr:galanin peptides [Erinaceus europaeus]